MPITECTLEGKPGFKYGSGTCYTHDGSDAGKLAAKKKAIRQALAIGGGKAPRDLASDEGSLLVEALRELDELQTVTLQDVELLEAGIRIHGRGSPPEGDVFTPGELRAMAQAAQELEQAGEWRIPVRIGAEPLGRTKLGHDDKQALLSSIDLGELPAAGWLTNQRVSGDGMKLLADITDVPRKVADLIKARAYRTRSAELKRVRSQKTGKTYDWVVSGLAWLGGKLPAVRTLDDIVALYGDDVDAVRVYAFEAPAGENEARADTRPMPEITLSEEQVGKLAAALAVDGDVTADRLLEAADERKTELDATKLEVSEAKKTVDTEKAVADEAKRKLEETAKKLEKAESVYSETDIRKLEEKANAGERAEKRLYEMERDSFIKEAIVAGKFRPGQLKELTEMYDAGPKATRNYIQNAPTHSDLQQELGNDSDRYAVDDETKKQYEGELAQMVGLSSTEDLL